VLRALHLGRPLAEGSMGTLAGLLSFLLLCVLLGQHAVGANVGEAGLRQEGPRVCGEEGLHLVGTLGEVELDDTWIQYVRTS
jgi:hypothetical protein